MGDLQGTREGSGPFPSRLGPLVRAKDFPRQAQIAADSSRLQMKLLVVAVGERMPGWVDEALRAGADLQLRLSSLTLPHALVRVLLAEQLYRALSLLDNHPYHRE